MHCKSTLAADITCPLPLAPKPTASASTTKSTSLAASTSSTHLHVQEPLKKGWSHSLERGTLSGCVLFAEGLDIQRRLAQTSFNANNDFVNLMSPCLQLNAC